MDLWSYERRRILEKRGSFLNKLRTNQLSTTLESHYSKSSYKRKALRKPRYPLQEKAVSDLVIYLEETTGG